MRHQVGFGEKIRKFDNVKNKYNFLGFKL